MAKETIANKITLETKIRESKKTGLKENANCLVLTISKKLKPIMLKKETTAKTASNNSTSTSNKKFFLSLNSCKAVFMIQI
jgi:hypothetical protein